MCLRMSSSPVHSPADSRSALNYKRSRSCGTFIDIDNKIAQAMDLVKIHMLSAVREEVEPLREKIKNLTERSFELERENHLLRCMIKYQILLRSNQITNYLAALTSGQTTNHQAALTSGQTTNHHAALTSGQTTNHHAALTSSKITNHHAALTSGQITNHHAALTSGQITNHHAALTSRQITNHNTALTSGQITNHHAGLTSGQITNHHAGLTSDQTTNHQSALMSDQITNHQRALSSNHHCGQHDRSIYEQSENFIFRGADYQNNECFSVNTQRYLNVVLNQDVTC